jgi:hypothetical protein
MSSWNNRYPKKIVNRPFEPILPVKEIPPIAPQIIVKPELIPNIQITKEEPKKEIASSILTVIQPINILFISNIQSGGTKKYIDDIISNFESKNVVFHKITSKKDLFSITTQYNITNRDIIFFQHLINTDLEIKDIIYFKQEHNCKLIYVLHDFYLLKDDYQHYNPKLHSLYLEQVKPLEAHQELFNYFDEVVAPSNFVLREHNKVYKLKNAVVSEHIDYLSRRVTHYIPEIKNNTINIAVPHEFSEYKGKEYYLELIESTIQFIYQECEYNLIYHIFPKKYDPIISKLSSNENVVIHPEYTENELYKIFQENNIHLLTYLNKWGETYCYSLTKGINSGLPILYNNIGALKERLNPLNDFYFPVEIRAPNKTVQFDDIQSQLVAALKFIINKIDAKREPQLNNYLHIPQYYYNLFNIPFFNQLATKQLNNSTKLKSVHTIVQPYAIYFPQFHEIEENNLTYYKGFTDLVNLESLIHSPDKNKYSFKTPLKGLLGFYDLQFDNITNTQVELAKTYGIKGFAIYYYWFSKNTVTGKRHIMKDVVDKFFKDPLENFDIFFIFANESWSNNPAFTSSNNNNIIKTEYTVDNIFAICINLIPYFKHSNYKKINNKPVLLLHQPWELSRKQLKLFKSILDVVCIDNDFDGAHLIINSMNDIQEEFDHYSHHPIYKHRIDSIIWKDNHTVINYQDYVENYIDNNQKELKSIVRGCFPHFNNYVRLFYNNMKDNIHTSTENNSDELFRKFIRKQLRYYKNKSKSDTSEVGKIFLLNSWNEWGEQMAFEPSNEDGFKYLDILYNELISLL